MSEEHPTNHRLAELLEQIADELRDLKAGQQQIAAQVRELTDARRD